MGPIKRLVSAALFSLAAMGSAHAGGGPFPFEGKASFKQYRKDAVRKLRYEKTLVENAKPGPMKHQLVSIELAHSKGLLRKTKAEYVREQKESRPKRGDSAGAMFPLF